MTVWASSGHQLQREPLANAHRACVTGSADVGSRQIARNERSLAADAVKRLPRYGTGSIDRREAIQDQPTNVLANLLLVPPEGCLGTKS